MTHAMLAAAGIRLHAIAAMAANRVIGREGSLPWHLPEDLKSFKRRTLDHPIIMGRATFESLPGGKPLPRRRHIVLTRTLPPTPGIEIIRRPEDLPNLGIRGDAFVIGGAAVFAAFLPFCHSVILSAIHQAHEGDTFMPEFEDTFTFDEVLEACPDFEVRLYRRAHALPSLG